MLVPLLRSAPVAVVAASDASVGDSAATRTVYVVVVALAVIGCALLGLAVWLWRQTRPDRELLAPLELMDERGWRRLGPQDRRRSLDEARPPGAQPIDRARSEPAVDQEFAADRPVRDFRDLADRPDDPLVISDASVIEATSARPLAPPEALAPPAGGSVPDGDVPDRPVTPGPDDIDGVERPAAAPDHAERDADAGADADTDTATVSGRTRTVEWIESRVADPGTDDDELDLPLLPGENILRRPRPGS